MVGAQRLPASCMNMIDVQMMAPPERPANSPEELFNIKKINELLPAEIKQNESGSVIINKIADRGFQKVITSDQFKSTPIGVLNEKVKDQTKIELNLKPDGEQIEHKLKAQVQPFQGGATLSYSGYFGVDFTFLPANDTQKIKIEDIVMNKKIYYENSQGPFERLQHVGVRWDW